MEKHIKRLQQAVEEAKQLKKALDRQIADISKLIKKAESINPGTPKPNGKK
jgi:hypothetical protein